MLLPFDLIGRNTHTKIRKKKGGSFIMNRPKPDDDEDILSKILFSGKPYDPCNWMDPRNEFLFEDDDQDKKSNTNDNED